MSANSKHSQQLKSLLFPSSPSPTPAVHNPGSAVHNTGPAVHYPSSQWPGRPMEMLGNETGKFGQLSQEWNTGMEQSVRGTKQSNKQADQFDKQPEQSNKGVEQLNKGVEQPNKESEQSMWQCRYCAFTTEERSSMYSHIKMHLNLSKGRRSPESKPVPKMTTSALYEILADKSNGQDDRQSMTSSMNSAFSHQGHSSHGGMPVNPSTNAPVITQENSASSYLKSIVKTILKNKVNSEEDDSSNETPPKYYYSKTFGKVKMAPMEPGALCYNRHSQNGKNMQTRGPKRRKTNPDSDEEDWTMTLDDNEAARLQNSMVKTATSTVSPYSTRSKSSHCKRTRLIDEWDEAIDDSPEEKDDTMSTPSIMNIKEEPVDYEYQLTHPAVNESKSLKSAFEANPPQKVHEYNALGDIYPTRLFERDSIRSYAPHLSTLLQLNRLSTAAAFAPTGLSPHAGLSEQGEPHGHNLQLTVTEEPSPDTGVTREASPQDSAVTDVTREVSPCDSIVSSVTREVMHHDSSVTDVTSNLSRRHSRVADVTRNVSQRDGRVTDVTRNVSQSDSPVVGVSRETSPCDSVVTGVAREVSPCDSVTSDATRKVSQCDSTIQCSLLTDLLCSKCHHVTDNSQTEQVPSQSTEGTPYKCSHCGIIFDDMVLHSIHMICHSQNDPYMCNICGRECGNKYAFYAHIMRGHQHT